MDHAKNRAGVDAAMKSLPALSTQSANPARGRSNRKRNQQNKGCEADGDEGALDDVFQHSRNVKGLIGTEIGEKVQTHVKESEKAEHAPEANQLRKIQDFTKWSDAQGENEKTQRPVACLMLEKLDRIGGEVATISAPRDRQQGDERKQEQKNFRPSTGKKLPQDQGERPQ